MTVISNVGGVGEVKSFPVLDEQLLCCNIEQILKADNTDVITDISYILIYWKRAGVLVDVLCGWEKNPLDMLEVKQSLILNEGIYSELIKI